MSECPHLLWLHPLPPGEATAKPLVDVAVAALPALITCNTLFSHKNCQAQGHLSRPTSNLRDDTEIGSVNNFLWALNC